METWVGRPSPWSNPLTWGKLENILANMDQVVVCNPALRLWPQDSCLGTTSSGPLILLQGFNKSKNLSHSQLKTPQIFLNDGGIKIRQYRVYQSDENKKKSQSKYAKSRDFAEEFRLCGFYHSLSATLIEIMLTVPFQFG